MFLTEITRWVEERRDSERLTRQQLGALGGIERLQAQRQSLLDNIAHYFRAHPGADAALGVLVLATVFSDNNAGCCTLSTDRMARFLSRSPRRITAAIAALNEARTIVVERVDGGTSRIYPWVHAVFGSTKDPVAWIMDVRAPSASTRRPGRPSARNTPDASVTPISEMPLTPVTNTPDACDQIPPTQASPNTTIRNTTHEGETRERAPGRASQRGGAVEISEGVRHLTAACVAQRFGDRPKGRDLAEWQRVLEDSPQCRQLSSANADELASVIVAAGERFWPPAAAIRKAVETRATHLTSRADQVARYHRLKPLRDAYLADVAKSEEIDQGLPRINYRSPDYAQLSAERTKQFGKLKVEAGIDLSRHSPEATQHLSEPPTYPITFFWPECRTPAAKGAGRT